MYSHVPNKFLLTGGCAACQGDQLEVPCSGHARHGLLRVPAGCASGTLFSFFPSGAQHRPRGQETIQTRKGRANARTIRRCNVDSVRPNTSNAASSPRSRKDLLRAKRRARGGRFLRPCVIMQIFSIPPYHFEIVASARIHVDATAAPPALRGLLLRRARWPRAIANSLHHARGDRS